MRLKTSMLRRVLQDRWVDKLENRLTNLRLLNKQIQNLKLEYGEYDDYYRDQRKKYKDDVDENLINVNIQLNYKGNKYIELKEISKNNLNKVNNLNEKLIENRERLINIRHQQKDLESGVNSAAVHVTDVSRKEMLKKYMLVGLILLLGLLDFVALVYRVTRLFG